MKISRPPENPDTPNFDNYQDDGKTLMVAEFDVTDQVIRTVESAVAELSKQNEPVAFTNSAQLGYVTSGQHQDIPLAMWSRNTSYSGDDIPLCTFPPTAEQIANETAYAWVSVDERLPEVGFYLAWVKDDSAKFGGMLMIFGYLLLFSVIAYIARFFLGEGSSIDF